MKFIFFTKLSSFAIKQKYTNLFERVIYMKRFLFIFTNINLLIWSMYLRQIWHPVIQKKTCVNNYVFVCLNSFMQHSSHEGRDAAYTRDNCFSTKTFNKFRVRLIHECGLYSGFYGNQKWIKFVSSRKEWKPSNNSVICSGHFESK